VKRLTIAIDGKSSCGKSTLAKALAKSLGYIYVDTGAMYRGVTWFALENNWLDNDKIEKSKIITSLSNIDLQFKFMEGVKNAVLFVNGKNVEDNIRTIHVANFVSKIAEIKEVRTFLVDLQRKMGEDGGVVMDGRDIGSVVFPNAEVKFFLTATPEIRSKRRFEELKAKGDTVSLGEVYENLKMRDDIDTTRTESPLIQTEDAIVIDNSELSEKEQLDLALGFVKNKLARN
jgi:cytidylate kinase